MIANLKWVKAVNGNKDDNTKDSKWIGDLFRSIVFSYYGASLKRRPSKCWSPLKASPWLTSRKFASKSSVIHWESDCPGRYLCQWDGHKIWRWDPLLRTIPGPVWFLQTALLLGWIDSRQQRVRRTEKVCVHFSCHRLPQTNSGTGRSRSGKEQRKPLLNTKIRVHRQAQRQETSDHRHCQNAFDDNLFDVLHRWGLESRWPLQSWQCPTIWRSSSLPRPNTIPWKTGIICGLDLIELYFDLAKRVVCRDAFVRPFFSVLVRY